MQEYREQLQFKTWLLVKHVHTQSIMFVDRLHSKLEITLICIYFILNGNSKALLKVHQYKTKHPTQLLFCNHPQSKAILQDQLYLQTAHKIQIKATQYSDFTLTLDGNHGETKFRMVPKIHR